MKVTSKWIMISWLLIHSNAAQKIELITTDKIPEFLELSSEYNAGILGKDTSEEFGKELFTKLGGLIALRKLSTVSDLVANDSLLLYPIGKAQVREAHNKQWKESDFALDKLINFLDPLIKGQIEQVSGSVFEAWLKNKLTYGNKFVVTLFENNPNKKHLAYRSLSEIPVFSEKFHFTFVNSETQHLVSLLKIQKFPTLMGFYLVANKGGEEGQEDQKAISAFPFQGPVNFITIGRWLEGILQNQEKNKPKGETGSSNEENRIPEFSDEISIMDENNTKQLLAECQNISCLLAFENFWIEDKSRYEQTVATLKKVQKQYSRHGMKVILIDGGCHEYLLPNLNIQSDFLPNLVIYNGKDSEFYSLMGKFDYTDIIDFIKRMNAKVYKPTKLESQLVLKKQDCKLEKEKWIARTKNVIQKSEEEDELMKELMAEIKNKENERKFVKQTKKRRSSEL